jgi:hypothetical protein
MLGDAIEYPARGEDALTTVLVGGLLPILAILIAMVGTALAIVLIGLVILPFAVVPGIVLLGYYVAVLRAVTAGESDPPRFRDWGRLFVDGLRYLAISLAYALPLLVLIGLFFGVVAAGGAVAGDATTAVEIAVTVAAVLVGGLAVCYLLAFAYLRPLAIANFAREGRLRAAFDVGILRRACLSKPYAIAWFLAILVWLVGATLEGALSFVLVGFFVGFYAAVARQYLYGRGLRTALGEGATTSVDADEDMDREAVGDTEREVGTETGAGIGTDDDTADLEPRPLPREVLPVFEEPERYAAREGSGESADRERGWTDWKSERRE